MPQLIDPLSLNSRIYCHLLNGTDGLKLLDLEFLRSRETYCKNEYSVHYAWVDVCNPFSSGIIVLAEFLLFA